MKILLVPNATGLDGVTEKHIPLGLLYVATALRDTGYGADILDINLLPRGTTVDQLTDEILSRDADVVGFSAMCDQYPRVISLCRGLKRHRPDIVTILGGPEATLTAAATLEHFPQVDLVAGGECEYTITRLVDAMQGRTSLRDIPGVTYRDGHSVTTNPPLPLIGDLDALAFPNYELLPSIRLFWTEYNLPMPIEAGRGCPYACTFCSLTTLRQRRFRLRSPKRLIGMARKMTAEYGSGRIVFLHDNFTASRRRVLNFCHELKNAEMDIEWQCSSRADSLDDELLERMAETGCRHIYLGIETGSARMQGVIRKNLDLAQVLTTVERMVGLGIRFTASFIAGFPEERAEDLVATIRFMMKLLRVSRNGPDRLQLHRLCPLHGSPLYEEYGSLLTLDATRSDLILSDLSDEDAELVAKHPRIFSSFYRYPAPHLDAACLARVPYFILNVLRLPYTALMLLADPSLNFPQCVLSDGALTKLMPGHPYHDIGTPASLKAVCGVLEDVLVRNGVAHHPIFDVMKYDLAVTGVVADVDGESSASIERFGFDVHRWVEEFEALRFHGVPEMTGDAVDILFAKDGNAARITPLPRGLVHS